MIAALLLCASLPNAAPQIAVNQQPAEERAPTPSPQGWYLEYHGMEPIPGADENIQVVQLPVFHGPDAEVHATWAIFWMDQQQLSDLRDDSTPAVVTPFELPIGPRTGQESGRRPLIPTMFEEINESSFAGLIREVYLEGPVEVFRDGERVAWCDAVYLDAITGHGWIANANIGIATALSGDDTRVRVQADWLRYSADGSLRADDATVTTSDFDVPSYYVRSHDLRLTPYEEEGRTFIRFELKKNSINLNDLIILPLPRVAFSTDEEYNPLPTLRFGDQARTGFFLSTRFRSSAGGIGRKLNSWVGGDEAEFDGRVTTDVSWFSSRGPFLDLGVELESPQRYWLDLYAGGVYDTGSDRGVVRVDESDRGEGRWWTRMRGRFLRGPQEWLDVVATHQSDASVQSEFWEREWFNYEERETYLRWRRARDEEHVSAIAQVRTDDFRSQVERLPEVEYDRGRVTLGAPGGVPLVYSTESSAGYLRRVEGDGIPGLWQDAIFADGLGEHDVARFDTTHLVESPFETGFAGVKLVPFVEAGGTFWSEDVNDEDQAHRAYGAAGVRAATTLWKLAGSYFFELAPFAELRDAFAVEEDGTPVTYDRVELPIDGTQVSVGLRSRWKELGTDNRFDLELRTAHLSGMDTVEDGWLPLSVFGNLATSALGIPIEIFHDGRRNLRKGETIYSLTSVGLDLTEDVRLVLGHRFGRDTGGGSPLFETATIGGLYRWTPKWEFEGGYSFSSRSDGQDVTVFGLRRFGADFVLELEVGHRQGVGTFFDIGVRPAIGYSRRKLGALGIGRH